MKRTRQGLFSALQATRQIPGTLIGSAKYVDRGSPVVMVGALEINERGYCEKLKARSVLPTKERGTTDA